MIREILKLLSRDNLQVQALSECYEMLDICHTMVHSSVRALRQTDSNDVDADVNVYDLDRKVNSFERDVRRKVMTHLSLGNTADITSGLTLISIVIDIERIGDYTKNIHDLAHNHPGKLDGGDHEAIVKEIENTVLENFDRTVTAFKAGDADDSRKLMLEYKEDISSKVNELEKSLVSTQTSLPTQGAVALALYMRFLKRISAHSRNLISSLVNPIDRIGYHEKK